MSAACSPGESRTGPYDEGAAIDFGDKKVELFTRTTFILENKPPDMTITAPANGSNVALNDMLTEPGHEPSWRAIVRC